MSDKKTARCTYVEYNQVCGVTRNRVCGIQRVGWVECILPESGCQFQTTEVEKRPTLHPHDEHALQAIDAAVFSSDTFWRKENRERLEYFIGRWTKALSTMPA